MVTFDSALDAALRYAARGWHVFPCRPDKTPHTEHGFKDATTDQDQINKWWRRWPAAQVGVACGPSGLMVVDLDIDKDRGKDGVAAFDLIREARGRHGCGLIAATPRGGQHLYYLAPDPPCGCGTDLTGPSSGIDVRAEGGYVVAPSPVSEGRKWLFGEPIDPPSTDTGASDLCAAPAWVLELCRAGRGTPAITDDTAGYEGRLCVPMDPDTEARCRDALRYVENDTRKSWIRVGMALKSTGAREQAFALWNDWSMHAHQPDGAVHPKYDEQDQRKQWRSLREFRVNGTEVALATLFYMAKQGGWDPDAAAQAAIDAMPPPPTPAATSTAAALEVKAARRPLTVVRPFDRGLLNVGGVLGDIAQWVTENGPRQLPALALGSAIACVGALLGRRVCTETGSRTNIYALGMAETTYGKGATLKLPQLLFARARLERFVGPSSWKSDAGLRSALQLEPSHVCMVDEFTKVLAAMSGRDAPPHLRGVRTLILDLFDKADGAHLAPAYADREKNKPVTLHEPNFGIYGVGVPAELLTSLDRGALADGTLNRFLVFFAEDQLPARQDIGSIVPPDTLVAKLVALEKATAPPGNLAGKTSDVAVASGCRTVPYTPAARGLWESIRDDQDAKVGQLIRDGDPMKDLWGRYAEHVGKVALVRAVSDDPGQPIGEHDVAWARDLVVWCTERMQCLVERRLADTQEEARTQRLLRLVDAAGRQGITLSTLTRKAYWLRRGDRKDILQTLVDGGDVVSPPKPRGSRQPTVYVATAHLSEAELKSMGGATGEANHGSANGQVDLKSTSRQNLEVDGRGSGEPGAG